MKIVHRIVEVVRIRKNEYAFYDILLYKNKLIGKKYSDSNSWVIKFPYKFFIDKKKL